MKFLEESFAKVYFHETVTFCEYIKDITYCGKDCNINYRVLNCCESCLNHRMKKYFIFFQPSFCNNLYRNHAKINHAKGNKNDGTRKDKSMQNFITVGYVLDQDGFEKSNLRES